MNYYLKQATKIITRFVSDKLYLKITYRIVMGKKLNLDNPITFSEKLQWLKLHDRKPIYQIMVDKVRVKDYVAEVVGENYVIPTIGVWEHPNEIDFESLPNQFVLKCNHNSANGLYICKDKASIKPKQWKQVVKNLKRGLRENYYLNGREWPYKNMPRRILAEKFMVDNVHSEKALVDYKFFCFNGCAENVMLCLERETGDTKFYFFDRDWKLVRCNTRGKAAPEGFTLPKPKGIDEMFLIADKLSKNIPFVRVDLYLINGQIYFGEMTFFPGNGMDPNLLPETDITFGSMIDLNTLK